MANLTVTRTYVGSIQNHRQVSDGLDSLGDSASKIWNVARWTAGRIWDVTGEIPDEGVLKSCMKNRSCWKDLNAQSSQKVIEELSDAFQSWFDLRHKFDEANPPGYRKHGDTRPRSTVTFKEDGFKHDPENNRVRLSKGSNLKEYWSDFLLCEYQTRPDIDLSEVNRVQNVRAVWNGDEWELHFVCKVELETNDSAGDEVAGLTLASRTSPRSRSRTNTFSTPVTRSKKTSTTSNEPSTTPKVRTAPRRSRCGHVGNSQTVRRTSTTSSRTP